MDIPLLLRATFSRSGMNRPKVTHFRAILAALIIVSGAAIVPVLPYAEAATTTISTNTIQDLTVNEGDTVIIESGVELASNTITNHGTIINYGSVLVGQNLTNTGAIVNNGTLAIQGAALNDGGTTDSYGEIVYQGHSEPGFVNSNGGEITIREDGQFRFHREGSSEPRSLFNEENSGQQLWFDN
jgi:hypothetical protein